MKKLKYLILLIPLILLLSFNSIFAEEPNNITANDSNFSFDSNSGILTVLKNTTVNQSIKLGYTTYGTSGKAITQINLKNSTLSFPAKSTITYTTTNEKPLNNTYGSPVNGSRPTPFAIIIDSSVSSEKTPITGTGNIIISDAEANGTSTLYGLIAIVGPTNTSVGNSTAQSININSGITIDASKSEATYIDSNPKEIIGFGIGIQGNITTNLSCNVTGDPAVFGAFTANTASNQPPDSKNGTTTINISGGSYQTFEANPTHHMGAVRTYGYDNGSVDINISGGNISGSPEGPGIYSSNSAGKININSNSGTTPTISGTSGIVARTGTFDISAGNIIGEGSPDKTIDPSGSDAGNGSAIAIQGYGSKNNGTYINLNLSGGYYEGAEGEPAISYGNPSSSSFNPFDQGDMNITGGNYQAGEGTDSVFGLNSSGESGFIKGPASFSEPVESQYLSSSNNSLVVTTINSNGEKEYTYFGGNTQGLAAAKNFAEVNNGNIYKVTVPENGNNEGIAEPGPYIPPTATQVPDTYTYTQVYSLELGNNLLPFYNSSGTGTVNQQQNVGLVVNGTPNLIPASEINWQITSLSSTGNTITFNNNNTGSGTNYENIISDDGHWEIRQYTENAKLSGVYLYYDGLDDLSGIYQLTATAQHYNDTIYDEAPSDSIRLTVSNTNITSATITDAPGSTTALTSPTIVDLETIRFLTPGYTASTASGTTTGQVVNWSIDPQGFGTNNTSNYYSFNEETGQITFLQALPQGAFLTLNLSVDGYQANPVVIMTEGNVVPEDPESIEAYLDPLTLYSGGSYYDLVDNIIFKPVGVLPDTDDLVFTSTSNNVLIYNQTIIPSNTNFNGTVPITATYPLEDGTELTCTFDINFVSQQVNATGITAEDSLTFGYPDLTPQNVNARLTPDNTTAVYQQKSFTYTTSNSSVAVVDDFGNVTAVGEGTCTITTSITGISTIPSTANTAKTTVTVSSTPSDIPATGISVTPGQLNLTTKEGGTTQADVTVTLTPADSTSEIVPVSSAPSVATVEAGETPGTYTVKAVSDGVCQITFQAGSVTSNPVKVIVSSQNFVADSILALGIRPDEFTVSVSGIKPNPALTGITGNVQGVSIFTWTGPDQNDKQCHFVSTANADGAYIYTPFTVNGNDVNTYYYNADNIYVQVYARVDGQDVYLGSAEGGNYSWINPATATATDTVAYITYQENIAFNRPTVFNGAASGVTGRHLQLEGLRVSSNIEGVKVITDVHEQNIGWVEGKDDGVYAGTMHENRQLEAVRLRLVGDNASNYDIWYQAHVENIGWQAPVKNNEVAGTTGQNLQMESIKIQIVPKGETPTGWENY